MKKIAIFENEVISIGRSFDAINVLNFEKKLEFTFFESSQKFGNLSRVTEYDVVIIDISLSLRSKMDGYQILQELKDKNLPTDNIIVLTGHDNVNSRLKEMGFNDMPVVRKVIDLNQLTNAINKILSKTSSHSV